jgi:ankyrin repeat protein
MAMVRVVLLAVALVAWSVGARAGPLFDAAAQGDLALVERLLASGSPVDEPGRNRETPLMAAALGRLLEVAALLVDRGADVMARNRGGLTPLHAAAYAGSAEIAALLLDHGAALEDRANKAGVTPLLVAVEQGGLAVTELLVARGADIEVLDDDGYSPLTQAWSRHHPEVVRLLKAHGAVCQSVEVLGGESYRESCLKAGS